MNRERLVFGTAAAVIALHFADELFIARTEPIEPAALVPIAILFATAILYPRFGPWRGLPAILFGLIGVILPVQGHLLPVLRGEWRADDLTGLMLIPLSAALLTMGLVVTARLFAARAALRRPAPARPGQA